MAIIEAFIFFLVLFAGALLTTGAVAGAIYAAVLGARLAVRAIGDWSHGVTPPATATERPSNLVAFQSPVVAQEASRTTAEDYDVRRAA